MKSLLLRFPIRIAGCVTLGVLPLAGQAQSAAPAPQKMAPAAARPASAELTPEEIAAREKRLEWFHEAKFGLFIHWGLYSIPAGYWKGERSPGIGEWIMNRMKIPVGEYEKLAGGFNPYKFDAEAWAQLAQDAGMKYVVITSKHHDGFAMYRSAVSKYNIYDATPWRRDPLKELAEACAKRGLKFGFYYSQSQDWHEPGGAGNTWDFGPDEAKYTNGSYDKYLQEKAEPQVKELLQNYGPVCLIWFDTAREMNGERGLRFIRLIRQLQPNTLIDGRLGVAGDYESTGDNAIPSTNKEGAWEVPATINRTWGFRSDDHDWKSPGDIVFKLVDIVSKGGNYLLNVGPTAEGVIPQPSQDNLRAVGEWLKMNGEAVYGAGRSPFGEEFGDYAANAKGADGKPLFLARNDWRCTTRPGRLYFTIFHGSERGPNNTITFRFPAFKNAIKSVTHIDESGRRQPLEVRTAADGTRSVYVPRMAINETLGSVIVAEIDGERVTR